MSYANRCHVCADMPTWTISRRGDAVISWACGKHLQDVLWDLQRDWEITELVVTDSRKASEWNGIRRSLQTILDNSVNEA